MTDSLSGPQFIQLFGPLISALKSLGGSARPAEVSDQVAADLGISDEEPQSSGNLSGMESRRSNS